MSHKKHPEPRWWKNTYFWIAGILFVVFLIGLFAGQKTIRDPGQIEEPGIVMWYLLAAAVMIVNGIVSHKQTMKLYEDYKDGLD